MYAKLCDIFFNRNKFQYRVQELESDLFLQEVQLDVSDFYKTHSLFKFICLKYEVPASLKMRIEAFTVE